ncbi:MAG: anaerobic sulfite reductase subunit AsrB [Lachnospiraceae bacterium]|nr:anaerobic sulfite reductase subunit AsrB [Lachnospiraceae bacterium]
MAATNTYIPFPSKILEIIRHTKKEYTFRMEYPDALHKIRPGQFFEISMPKFGEAPISVSGIGDNSIDFTIRDVGVVTDEVFHYFEGKSLLIRGPYGNGFVYDDYNGSELIVVAGGTGVSPVRGVIDHYAHHPEDVDGITAIVGFKSPDDILFRDDLDYWKDHIDFRMTVDSAKGQPGYREGFVTAVVPELTPKDLNTTKAIVVGPPPMMRFTIMGLLKLGIPETNIWLSQERKMCCGLGKCGHCKIGDTYVCLDGPVFPYTKSKTMID